jgi:hypothetical protein
MFFGANSKTLSFPEMVVPMSVVLRKFRKTTSNNAYRKTVGSFLELIKRNEDHVVGQRAKIAEKSLRDPAKLHQQFAVMMTAMTPLNTEAKRIVDRRNEQVRNRMESKGNQGQWTQEQKNQNKKGKGNQKKR